MYYLYRQEDLGHPYDFAQPIMSSQNPASVVRFLRNLPFSEHRKLVVWRKDEFTPAQEWFSKKIQATEYHE